MVRLGPRRGRASAACSPGARGREARSPNPPLLSDATVPVSLTPGTPFLLLQLAVHVSDDIESDNLGQLIEILRRETKGGHFDRTEVQSRLDDVMNAVGIFVPAADMTVEELQYGEAFSKTESNQTARSKEKAQYYKKISESPDPLGQGPIHSIYKTEINARARNRNSKDVNLTDRLSHDFALLRKVANELMTYNELLIRPGAPNKQPQQTLLVLLAELYVELTNKQFDPFDLPHAKSSRHCCPVN